MLGRLLQGLEHGVECRGREHVHLVDHIHLEAPARGRVNRVFQQLTHLVHLGVGGGIDFDEVDETAAVDLDAGRALAAGRGGYSALAVERLGKDARQRGLAHAARTGEQVGMVQALVLQCIGERAHDMLLPHQRRESPRAPFTGENLVAHRGFRIKDSESRIQDLKLWKLMQNTPVLPLNP